MKLATGVIVLGLQCDSPSALLYCYGGWFHLCILDHMYTLLCPLYLSVVWALHGCLQHMLICLLYMCIMWVFLHVSGQPCPLGRGMAHALIIIFCLCTLDDTDSYFILCYFTEPALWLGCLCISSPLCSPPTDACSTLCARDLSTSGASYIHHNPNGSV